MSSKGQTKANKNTFLLPSRSYIISEVETLHKIANNKNNLGANPNSRAQNMFIMDSSGRAKVEEIFFFFF